MTLRRQRDPHRLKQHIEPHIEKQRPDGICVDLKDRRVFVIEFVRTDDETVALRQALVRKNIKYQPLSLQLRSVLPNYSVELFTFAIGLRGSINEHLCRRHLFTIGLTSKAQDKLIQACMRATVEGWQRDILRLESKRPRGVGTVWPNPWEEPSKKKRSRQS